MQKNSVVGHAYDKRPEPERNVYAYVCEPLYSCYSLLRGGNTLFNPPGLFLVGGDDGYFDVPVVGMPAEKCHVPLVLSPPRRLCAE